MGNFSTFLTEMSAKRFANLHFSTWIQFFSLRTRARLLELSSLALYPISGKVYIWVYCTHEYGTAVSGDGFFVGVDMQLLHKMPVYNDLGARPSPMQVISAWQRG